MASSGDEQQPPAPGASASIGMSSDESEVHSGETGESDEEPNDEAEAVANAVAAGGNDASSAIAVEGSTREHFPARFSSWSEFEEYLREFCAATYQVLPHRGSVTVARRNSRLDASSPWVLPLAFEYYWKGFQCTHGVKQRKRSAGLRPRASVVSRSTGCTAKMNATLTFDRAARVYFVKVDVSGAHNHPVGRQYFGAYAQNRTITDPALLRVIEAMSARGENAKAIHDHIGKIVQEQTGKECVYTTKHVYNIMYRMRKERQQVQEGEDGGDQGVSREGEDESGSNLDSDGPAAGSRSKRRRLASSAMAAGSSAEAVRVREYLAPKVTLSRLGVRLDSIYCYEQIRDEITQIGVATVELLPGTISGFKHEILQLSPSDKSDDVDFVLPRYVLTGVGSGILEFCRSQKLPSQRIGVRLTVEDPGSYETRNVTLSLRQLLTMKRFYLASRYAADTKKVIAWIASSSNLEGSQIPAPFDEYTDFTKELFVFSLSVMPFVSPVAVSGTYTDIRNVVVHFADSISSANLLKFGGVDSNIDVDCAKAALLSMHSRFSDRASFLSPSFMSEGALADRCCAKGSAYGAFIASKRFVAGVAQLPSGRWGGIVLDCTKDRCYLYASNRAERKELQHLMVGLFNGYRLVPISFEALPPPSTSIEAPSLLARKNDSGILALLFVELVLQTKAWSDLGSIESLDYFRARYLLQSIQVVTKQNVHDIRWA